MPGIEAEERWRILFERSPDGILLVDEAGIITQANQRVESLFGHPHDELVGRSVEILLPKPARSNHARLRADFARQPASRAMAEGRPLVGLHRDGREVPVEIGLSTFEVAGHKGTMAIVRDVSAREATIEQLRVQSAALEAAASGIAISTPEGRCTWVNPAFTRMTGRSLEEMVGRRFAVLKSGVHDDAFFRHLWETISSGRVWHGEIVNRRKDGSLYTEEQTIAPVIDNRGAITHYIAIKSDISERKRMETAIREANERLAGQLEEIRQLRDELRDQAIRDPLTRLHNRRYLEEALVREVASAERFERPLSVALMDADHFKRVNDTHGHATGDLVLRQIADLLRAKTRQTDLVCRYGGEEFLVVMLGADSAEAQGRAESWRSLLARAPLDLGKLQIPVTVSIGVAEYHRGTEAVERTIERADTALYEAKRTGRNRVVVR